MPFKNPYAEKLNEFSSFVFNEPDIYRFYRASGGGWDEYFRGRMGAKESVRTVLEIGCSNAEFLSSIAKANPGTAFVGIDWKFKVVYKGGKKIARDKLSNIALIRGRAQDLSKVFGPGDLDEIWIFFPDPWAKKAQLKHRLVQEQFLLEAARWLKSNGRVFLKTDHPGYFQWMLTLFGVPLPELPEYDARDSGERSYRARQVKVRQVSDPELLPSVSEASSRAFRFDMYSCDYWGEGARPETLFSRTQTLFEKTFVKDNLPIYYLELTRK